MVLIEDKTIKNDRSKKELKAQFVWSLKIKIAELKSNGITYKKIAEQIGVAPSKISRFMKGDRDDKRLLHIEDVIMLIHIFDIDPQELFSSST